jgi:hypothetical protein
MEIMKIPDRLCNALSKRGHHKLYELSGKDAFREYCEWHGLRGWGGDLYEIAKFCIAQDLEDKKHSME